MQSWLRNARNHLGAAVGLTILFCFATSLLPIQFDVKTFGAVLLRTPIPAGFQHVVFFSRDRGWESGHLDQYALSLLPEPLPSVSWIVFAEGDRPSPWNPTGTIDQTGQLGGRVHAPLLFGPHTLVLVRDEATRAELFRRLPSAGASPIMINDVAHHSIFKAPHARWSLLSALRLFVLILAITLVGGYGYASGGAPGVALSLPLFIAGHVSLTYLLGFLTDNSLPLAIALELVVGLLLQFSMIPFARFRRPSWPVLTFAAALILMGAIRLDFDGDILTHWLPIARAHHARGSHDLPFLRAQFGGGHRVAYPPAFPIYLSTLMWVADVPRSTVDFGLALDRFSLLYRFMTTILQVLLLAVIVMTLGGGRAAVLAAALIAFAFPLLLGRPEAAECFLVPLAGFAAIALKGRSDWMRRAGLMLAGSLLLVKMESLLVVVLLLLPWYVASVIRDRVPRRARLIDATVLMASSLPFAVLRVEQACLGIMTTFDFKPLTRESLRSGLPSLPLILASLLKSVLASSQYVVLILVVTTILFLIARRQFVQAAVPLGVLVFAALLGFLYLFSARDVVWHIATSYSRVLDSALLLGAIHVLVLVFQQRPDVKAAEHRLDGDLRDARIPDEGRDRYLI